MKVHVAIARNRRDSERSVRSNTSHTSAASFASDSKVRKIKEKKEQRKKKQEAVAKNKSRFLHNWLSKQANSVECENRGSVDNSELAANLQNQHYFEIQKTCGPLKAKRV